MTAELVTIKGTSDGIVITLGAGPLEAVLDEMMDRLSSRASFFVGGRVALAVGNRSLSVEQLRLIGAMLQEFSVTLWAVESTHPTTCAAVEELGLETRLRPQSTGQRPDREAVAGLVVRRTLRSGQALDYPGHITLIGDVNAGAELAAGGDIVVWGKLRGTVHAGAMGDDEAMVCALQLAPGQIRIGGYIARSPERGRLPTVPEIARVHEGQIIVEQWHPESAQGFSGSSWKRRLGAWSARLRALFGRRPSDVG
jgi:septum site-determining protein MinC